MTGPARASFPWAAVASLGRYRLHHVGIVVPKLEEAIAAYSSAFEFRESSIPFHDLTQKVRVAFVRIGDDAWLEFIEPMGAETPVTQFLAKSRGGYHHVAFEVKDIDTAVRQFEQTGAVVVCRCVEGFEGRRIAFLFPKIQPNLLTELVGPHPAAQPHFTGCGGSLTGKTIL